MLYGGRESGANKKCERGAGYFPTGSSQLSDVACSEHRPVFDIACLNEQPSNKLRLHTLCHGGKLQVSSRGITHEQSHRYVRVGTMRGGLGIRLRPVVPGLWRVDPHDPLHLSPCIRLPLSGPT